MFLGAARQKFALLNRWDEPYKISRYSGNGERPV